LSDEIRILHCRRVDRHLVGAREQQLSYVADASDTAPHRQRHEAALGRARDDIEDRLAIVGGGSDVEEAELVGTRGIIGRRRLDRVAGIDEVDEIDALDDAAVLHVQAGDDAGFQHQMRSSAARKSTISRPTTGGTSPCASKAGS
jgi:hypothetical protein